MMNPVAYLRSVRTRVVGSFTIRLQRQIVSIVESELNNAWDGIEAEVQRQVNRAVENAINEYDFAEIVNCNLPEDRIRDIALRAVADEFNGSDYSELSIDIARVVADVMEDGDSPLSTAFREIAHAEIRHLLDLIGESVARMK